MMSRGTIYFAYVGMALIVAVMFGKIATAEKSLESEAKRYYAVLQKAEKISYLKQRFENDSYIEDVVRKLKKIATPSDIEVKEDFIELSFSGLNSSKLDELVQKLANYYVDISRLRIDKKGDECDLNVRIER